MNQRWITLATVIVGIALSMVFFAEETEAAPCSVGQYQELTSTGFQCSEFSDNRQEQYGSSDTSYDEGGPTWARQTANLFVSLAIVVGYATEVVAILVIGYAAYKYTVSGGEPNKMNEAKRLILMAITGVFIGAFSIVIARLMAGVFL